MTPIETISNMNTLEDILSGLESLGYIGELQENAIAVFPLGRDNRFPAVLTIDGEGNKVSITCQVATLGQFKEDDIPSLFAKALDENSIIAPYAYALLTSSDGEENDASGWPLVLIDSIPLGDFSLSELDSSISSLITALTNSVSSVFEAGGLSR